MSISVPTQQAPAGSGSHGIIAGIKQTVIDWTARSKKTKDARGTRPIRIANCSGAKVDPGYQMLRQATLGDVDVVTGDYLAEMNLANNAEDMKIGKSNGWEETAWDGIQLTMDAVAERGVKIIINGGALNPKGLAQKTAELAKAKGYHNLKVAFVSGDDCLPEIQAEFDKTKKLPAHLDDDKDGVKLSSATFTPAEDPNCYLITAHAYLGARAIVKALEEGADFVICGRVSDASPVIGAAQWWHGWTETQYDELAGSLLTGHLIECSGYACGANFAGFDKFDLDTLVDIGYPIAEIDKDGSCVITKHPGTNGIVNKDTITCQMLYELQGEVYLNSDVKAYLTDIVIEDVGKDRVRVSGIKGARPPATTKLAIFYHGGFQNEMLYCATGYATEKKWQLLEKQVRYGLTKAGIIKNFDVLEFQVVGKPEANPTKQLHSTTYCRVFSQARKIETIYGLLQTVGAYVGMQHFSGFHGSLDSRTALPKSFLAYYPAIIKQERLAEAANFIDADGTVLSTHLSGHPPAFEPLSKDRTYPPSNPVALTSFGPTKPARLGDLALARSGDKGANVNFGIFVQTDEEYDWLRNFMTSEKMIELCGGDWEPEFYVERCEFKKIRAVHFVIYGILGRGVSSTSKLDPLGKGFADYIRDKVVDVPVKFLQ